MNSRALVCPLVFLPIIGISSACAQEAPSLSQSLSAGAYYASGDYGQASDTSINYYPLSYGIDYGKWSFQLLSSHLEVEGVGNVLVNIGGVTQAVASNEITRSSGLGDSVFSSTYRFDPFNSWAPFVDLRFDVKIPTADEGKSLGTGEFDYTAQIDLSKNLGNSAIFASIGYTKRGRSELFTGLEDSVFTQLGFAHPISEKLSAGVYYDYRERASEFAQESHELIPFISLQLSQHWSLTGLITWGFTDASAQQSYLGQLSYRW